MSTEWQRIKWRLNQQAHRERTRKEPRPLSQEPHAVYKRARARGLPTAGIFRNAPVTSQEGSGRAEGCHAV